MADWTDQNQELRARLQGWRNDASEAVKEQIDLLGSESIETRTEAAGSLRAMGADAKGAILALVESWSWAPPRPERAGRSELTRRADSIRSLYRSIGSAMAAIGEPAVEPLVLLLKGEDERLREKAEVLARVTDPAAAGAVTAALNDTDAGVRRLAVQAVTGIGAPGAVEALAEAMADADEAVRMAAARALRKMGGAEAIGSLLAGLASDNPEVRQAARELANVDDPNAADQLLEALAGEQESVLVSVAGALARTKEQRAVEPLVGLLARPSGRVHGAATAALDKIDRGWPQSQAARAAVPNLLPYLRDDPALRSKVASTLGRIGDPSAFRALVEALGDSDASVRDAAAGALGALGDPEAVEPLLLLLQKPGDGPVGSRVVIGALGGLGDARAVEPLVAILNDEAYGVRAAEAAAVALGEIGDPAATGALEAVIKGHYSDGTRAAGQVARAARAALEKIGIGP